jgi:copper chaperone CopZ
MEKRLSVEGMTCAHCVRRVVKIIAKAPGVSGVQVSLENKEALFTCEPAATSVPDIVKAINDFGFTAFEKG